MSKHYLITGGAGFIGSNYVNRLLERGERVKVFDNLSRLGGNINIDWLKVTHGAKSFEMIEADIRDANKIAEAAKDADIIVHLAGQVAVTTSVLNPRLDFEENALGTFNTLEAARRSGRNPIFLYASTNKVYGGLEEIQVIEGRNRYTYSDLPFGVDEARPVDFHSPYGCSKGAGGQYVRDYQRIYDIPSVIFRQSCIYGPRQFGIEDQGWIAWFMIAAIAQHPITIFGNGKQMRDVLYVDDLLDVYDVAIEKIDQVAGQIFNIGGGPWNSLSIWQEFGSILSELLEREIPVERDDWRPGDQLVYVSDIRKAEEVLGWSPSTNVDEGIQKLFEWMQANKDLFN